MTPEHANEVIEHHKHCKNCDKCMDKEIEETLKRTRDNLSHFALDINSVMKDIESTYREGMGLDPLGEE